MGETIILLLDGLATALHMWCPQHSSSYTTQKELLVKPTSRSQLHNKLALGSGLNVVWPGALNSG